MQHHHDEQLLGRFAPEMRLLTALVGRALGGPGVDVPDVPPDAWARLPALAASHRVQPLAAAGLRDFGGSVPAPVRGALKREAERGWIQATLFAQEIARISGLFADAPLPWLSLKGPALGVQAYGAATARTMRDLDILIRPNDFPKTRALLEAGGFVWEDAVARLAPAQQNVYVRQTTDLQFRHARLGYWLEVHLRPFFVPSLLPVSVEELLAGADSVSVAGACVPTLSPGRHLLYVAAHGAKHGWWRLHWLADFAAFVGRHPEWAEAGSPFWADVHALGLSRIVGAAFYLSHLCFGTALPAGVPLGDDIGPLVAHGIGALARGRQPTTLGEKWAETRHFLRLRPDAAFRRDVLRFRRQVAQEDLVRFPGLGRMMILYPAVRPLFWLMRQLRSRHSSSKKGNTSA